MLYLLQATDFNGLGRFETSLLPDYEQMTLFVTNLSTSSITNELGGDVDDACTWFGVFCQRNQIERIQWEDRGLFLSASINFSMCPSHLSVFEVDCQNLVGEVLLSRLPETMRILSLHDCDFTGTLDFSALPPLLEALTVKDNQITSIRNICNLPETLNYMNVSEPKNAEKVVQVGKLLENDLVIEIYDCGIAEILLEAEADRKRVHWTFGMSLRG